MVSVRALVDTRATFPALPEDIVEKLGLPLYGRLKLRQQWVEVG